jgi:NADPH:quinone reductase-like Zn-dependent oxidoreductase
MDQSIPKYPAMACLSRGSHGVLEPVEFVRPAPEPGNLLIRITRSGVAFGDIIRSLGTAIPIRSYPWVPGYDLSGVVEEAGADSGLSPGDRVTAFSTTGSYAGYIELPGHLVMPLPDEVDDDAGCALNLNYLTAWQMMFRIASLPRLSLAGGRRPAVLIQSAAGGVGTALLQLARLFGFRAFGSARSAKLPLVEQLGGIPIDRESADPYMIIRREAPEGLDAVFETRGFSSAAESRRLLKRSGTVVVFGFLQHYHRGDFSRMIPLVWNSLGFFSPAARGRGRLFLVDPGKRNSWYREDMASILQICARGAIAPVIDSVMPLVKANEAWERLRSSRTRGKILLDPWQDNS